MRARRRGVAELRGSLRRLLADVVPKVDGQMPASAADVADLRRRIRSELLFNGEVP